MPPPLRDPEDPREWVRRARSNLARAAAGRPSPEVLYEDLAFDAQQAAEKAIKAVLVGRREAFPKTHSLERLLDLVKRTGEEVPTRVRQAARLTPFAAAARYPGVEQVTEEQYVDALVVARAVVEWAEEVIEAAPRRTRVDPPEAPQRRPGRS